MLYYHVYVRYYPSSRDTFEETYELDLPSKELREQIVTPYLNGETFMCGGHQVNPFRTEEIMISKSTESSDTLIPRIRAKEASESEKTGIVGGLPDEFLVIDHCENVTREFITHPPKKEEPVEKPTKTKEALSENVFIVHGRDHESMKELKAMLKEFCLNPIVLEELPGGSMTIIEKLEKYSEVGFAFAILTSDDVGFRRSRFQSLLRTATFEFDHKKYFLEETMIRELKPRARQNVLLEFGYFIGKLSRNRVCCLYKGIVELPSDMSGIVYIPFQESINEVRDKIVKELKAAGYEIRI